MTHNGYYSLWIESFDTSISPDDSINHQGEALDGSSTFMNFHGYLPSNLYPLMIVRLLSCLTFHHLTSLQFYGVMGVLYCIIGLAWMVCMFLYMSDLLRLQFWIGAVALICVSNE